MKSSDEVSSIFAGVENLTVEGVLRIRGLIYRHGTISADDAEALFQINDRVRGAPIEWHELF